MSAPNVLVCAGLDPSGGAGFLADARVIERLGGRAVGVVTALTVQNTTGVTGAAAAEPEQIREQLEFLLQDVEIRAGKIGMIGSADVAVALGHALALTGAPIVWDPVMAPTRGEVRFADGDLERAVKALAPHVRLLTPNAQELGVLAGGPTPTAEEAFTAARMLCMRLDVAVLVKGGHLGGDESVDYLVDGPRVEVLRAPRVPGGEDVHGTGCALSSAIAVHLALGAELVEACRAAKQFVSARIADPVRPGRGAAAVV